MSTVVKEWALAEATAPPIGVDPELPIIRGYVVALAGPFKVSWLGEFDEKSLKSIVALMKAEKDGLKVRFTHSMYDDPLGKYLGRAKNPRLDVAKVKRDGKLVELPAVRADLHLDPSSFKTPYGDLGGYVLSLAKSDSDALSSSLVLKYLTEWRMDSRTKAPARNPDTGETLPPIWRPTALQFSDVVGTGMAVDGLLSFDGQAEPPDPASLAADVVDLAFPDTTRDKLSAWLADWQTKYLDHRFGAPKADAQLQRFTLDEMRRDIEELKSSS